MEITEGEVVSALLQGTKSPCQSNPEGSQGDTYCGLDIRWTFIVRALQHRDDTDQDGLDSVHRGPAFACLLVSVLVLTWWVLHAKNN